jgi:hypothetical protein
MHQHYMLLRGLSIRLLMAGLTAECLFWGGNFLMRDPDAGFLTLASTVY